MNFRMMLSLDPFTLDKIADVLHGYGATFSDSSVLTGECAYHNNPLILLVDESEPSLLVEMDDAERLAQALSVLTTDVVAIDCRAGAGADSWSADWQSAFRKIEQRACGMIVLAGGFLSSRELLRHLMDLLDGRPDVLCLILAPRSDYESLCRSPTGEPFVDRLIVL